MTVIWCDTLPAAGFAAVASDAISSGCSQDRLQHIVKNMISAALHLIVSVICGADHFEGLKVLRQALPCLSFLAAESNSK